MYLVVALLLLAVVVYQWFAREAFLRIWGPLRVAFHRDEWPAFYWSVMALELLLAALFVYWYF